MLNFYFKTYKPQMILIVALWVTLIISSLILTLTLITNDTISTVVSYNAEHNAYLYTMNSISGELMIASNNYNWFFQLFSLYAFIKYGLVAMIVIFTFYVTTKTRWVSDQLLVGKNEQTCNLVTLITFPLVSSSILSLIFMSAVKNTLGAASIYTPSLIFLLITIALLAFTRYKLITSFGALKYSDNNKQLIITIVLVIAFIVISLTLNLLKIGIIPLITSIILMIWLILNIRKTARNTVGI